jgi:hypothetical protein
MQYGLSLRVSVLAVVVAMLSTAAQAVVIQGSIDDFEPQHRSDSGLYIASENFATGSRIGFQTNFNGSGANAPGGITSAYFFQLPALNAGESISGATFSVGRQPDTAATAVTPTFNADLYALGVIDTIAKTAEAAQKFFYLGDTEQTSLPAVGPPVGGPVARVANNFLLPEHFIAPGGTASATPNTADITSYIQNLYANPAANGFTPGTSYLILRLSPDADPAALPGGTQRYTTSFQGTPTNGGAGSPENRPMLTLVVVPEPASAGLLLAGALGLLRHRRRA